jgi:Global regulator protein family
MLVLRRKEGQWIEIAHKSGDTIRIRVYNIRSRFPGQLDLAFDDAARNFEVRRPERPASPRSKTRGSPMTAAGTDI